MWHMVHLCVRLTTRSLASLSMSLTYALENKLWLSRDQESIWIPQGLKDILLATHIRATIAVCSILLMAPIFSKIICRRIMFKASLLPQALQRRRARKQPRSAGKVTKTCTRSKVRMSLPTQRPTSRSWLEAWLSPLDEIALPGWQHRMLEQETVDTKPQRRPNKWAQLKSTVLDTDPLDMICLSNSTNQSQQETMPSRSRVSITVTLWKSEVTTSFAQAPSHLVRSVKQQETCRATNVIQRPDIRTVWHYLPTQAALVVVVQL